MAEKRKRPKVNGDARVLDAAKQLADAHGRVKGLKHELRGAEGDVRRSLSLLRKLTTPAARSTRVHVPRRFTAPANG